MIWENLFFSAERRPRRPSRSIGGDGSGAQWVSFTVMALPSVHHSFPSTWQRAADRTMLPGPHTKTHSASGAVSIGCQSTEVAIAIFLLGL
jgi:hypothetical protein